VCATRVDRTDVQYITPLAPDARHYRAHRCVHTTRRHSLFNTASQTRSRRLTYARRGGWIYVLQDPARPGCCKVGRTSCMWSRLSNARTFAPDIADVAAFATDDAVRAEAAARDLLSSSRIPGTEWHRCSKQVACAACALVTLHGGDRASMASACGAVSDSTKARDRQPISSRRCPLGPPAAIPTARTEDNHIADADRADHCRTDDHIADADGADHCRTEVRDAKPDTPSEDSCFSDLADGNVTYARVGGATFRIATFSQLTPDSDRPVPGCPPEKRRRCTTQAPQSAHVVVRSRFFQQ
jgi:hypothetical protein